MATVTSGTTATTANSTATKSSQSKLSQNYEMFLQLLTTQLKNQNPLEPMDADKFTAQLTQYSGIEQQIQTNTNLEELKSLMQTQSAANLVGYVGSTVTAEGASTRLENGAANWKLTSQSAMKEATVVIRNAAGAIVYTESLKPGSTSYDYTWNGKTTNGSTAPDGVYQATVTGKDSSGNALAVSTNISGKVTSVDMSQTPAVLKIGTIRVPLTSLLTVTNS